VFDGVEKQLRKVDPTNLPSEDVDKLLNSVGPVDFFDAATPWWTCARPPAGRRLWLSNEVGRQLTLISGRGAGSVTFDRDGAHHMDTRFYAFLAVLRYHSPGVPG
jgi:hypothetical protein